MDGTRGVGAQTRPAVTQPDRLDRPALGTVATADNADQIARVVLRGLQYGTGVLVACGIDSETDAVRFARLLGADVVPVEEPSSDEAVREALESAARSLGYPGLAVSRRTDRRVDYPATLDRFEANEDEFAVTAALEQADESADRTLVAIPAYEEADTVGDVVREADRVADVVLVVDDGSGDGTAAAAEAAGASVVRHDRNRGYGAALQTAFSEADSRDVDRLVTLDGDGQHDPTDVERLVERHRETGANVVIGSRFVGDGAAEIPRYRRFGIGVINVLTNLSFGVVRRASWIGDTQCGFRLYDREAIHSLATTAALGDHMSASTDILLHVHRRDYDVEEVGVVVDYDVADGSTVDPVSHGYVLVANILKTVERTRPLTALVLPGFLTTLGGAGLGYWGARSYLLTGRLPFDLSIAAFCFVLVGFLAVFTGIVLHSLNGYFDQLRVSL